MICKSKFRVFITCCGLGLCLLPLEAGAQVCPADEPVLVLHCGRDTILRCERNFTCPAAVPKVIVKTVPKIVPKVVVIKVKPHHRYARRPKDLLQLLFGRRGRPS